MARRTRARRGEGDKLRQEILEAAHALLVETGSQDAVSIRAIADRVGVTPPALYMHFPDKDQLFFELCESYFQSFAGALEDATRSVDDPVESLKRAGEAYIRFALENPEHYRVLFMSGGGTPPDRELTELAGFRCFMALVEQVQKAVDLGKFRPVEAFPTGVVLWASVHGLASLLITDDHFPWPAVETLIRNQIETTIGGLLA